MGAPYRFSMNTINNSNNTGESIVMHLRNRNSLPCNYRIIKVPDPTKSHQSQSQPPMKTQKPSERAEDKNLDGKIEEIFISE